MSDITSTPHPEHLTSGMASAILVEEHSEQLNCPSCHDEVDDPAKLACGHSVCKNCIENYFKREGRQFCCPVCSSVFHFTKQVRKAMLKNRANLGVTDDASADGTPTPPVTCALHWLPQNLLCRTDKKALCLVCTTLNEHTSHGIQPLRKPVDQEEENELDGICKLLRKKKVTAEKLQTEYEKMIKSCMDNMDQLKEHTAEEFQELHSLLCVEQEELQCTIEKESKTMLSYMENNVMNVTEEVFWLTAIEEQIKMRKKLNKLREPVTASIVNIIANCESQIQRQKSELMREIKDKNICGPSQYKAWSALRNIIKPVPVSLSLDHDTVHPHLILSKDLKRVGLGHQLQDLPKNPKRFEKCLYVLSSQGFQSGRHYWEVDVGSKSNWAVGIVKESVSRKKEEIMSPENGYWILRQTTANEYYILTSVPRKLHLKPSPTRIGILLNYAEGYLSFYSASNMFHLFTFWSTFDQKVFPFFCPGVLLDENEDWEPLRLCF
ncbi:nuclear factor 7, brain-like [Protopterus annectens]|uniref:nuclear factor 7, brain-like n=1 Tax=Protopterus annectens TaxID=7888 RepID=UPI001CF98BF7|nr:nuclear factor 7, brain-like [Protopterus annectens]